MKRAVIVGWRGQDGTLLTQQLLAAGYQLLGVGRSGSAEIKLSPHGSGSSAIETASAEPDEIVRDFRPDEVYYLAAYHHSAEAQRPGPAELLARSYEVHVHGLVRWLDAIAVRRLECRLFYAASSHAFGSPVVERIDESTPLNPICIYGITKTAGVHCCRFYRRQHGVFASVGFLFNHESIYRREDFLSKKIIRAAVEIKLGKTDELILGDLSAVVDWGYAGDYTLAMQDILSLGAADDFIIASGIPRTVRNFVETVFGMLDLDWREYVRENSDVGLTRRNPLIGDMTRLRERSGRQPQTSFESMIADMVRFETDRRLVLPS